MEDISLLELLQKFCVESGNGTVKYRSFVDDDNRHLITEIRDSATLQSGFTGKQKWKNGLYQVTILGSTKKYWSIDKVESIDFASIVLYKDYEIDGQVKPGLEFV